MLFLNIWHLHVKTRQILELKKILNSYIALQKVSHYDRGVRQSGPTWPMTSLQTRSVYAEDILAEFLCQILITLHAMMKYRIFTYKYNNMCEVVNEHTL